MKPSRTVNTRLSICNEPTSDLIKPTPPTQSLHLHVFPHPGCHPRPDLLLLNLETLFRLRL